MAEPDRFDLAATRVAPPRRRVSLFLAAWLVVLGGFVALGLSGRLSTAAPTPGPIVSGAAPTAAAVSGTTSPTVDVVRSSGGLSSAPPTVVVTSAPGPLVLQATRILPDTVFVHGDVFAPNLTWIFVSLQDEGGQVGGWASVSVPGSAGPTASGEPALRFDVELAVPAELQDGSVIVRANAYDHDGSLVATSQVGLAVDGTALPTRGGRFGE